jgi:hypothetical protein
MNAGWLFLSGAIALLLGVVTNWIPKPSWLHPAYVILLAVALLLARFYVNGKSSAGSSPQHPGAGASPFMTFLPADSPLRKQILDIDRLCAALGISDHAWLPGQRSANDINHRTIVAAGAAYTWSCSMNGRTLIHEQLNRGCRFSILVLKPIQWIQNDAYSWICI